MMKNLRPSLVLAAAMLAFSCDALAQNALTPRVDVTDSYHGVTVSDPYRWLENATDPKVQAWTAAQSERTRATLDALPSRAGIKARLTALITRGATSYSALRPRGERVFAMRSDPRQQQAVLVALNAAAEPASAEVVVDPNALDPNGKTTIDWFRPSADGNRVAVSMSQNGSEIGTLFVYDVATRQPIGTPIPRVQAPTAGGSLAWLSDGSAFWYTRYPGEERPEADRFFYQQVYFHRIGTEWRNDKLVLGEKDGLPRVAEIFLGRDNRRDLIVAQVQNGDGGEYAHYSLSLDGLVPLATFKDKIVDVVSSPTGVIFALSRADAHDRRREAGLARGGRVLAKPIAARVLSE